MNVTFIIPYFYPAWQYGGQPRSAYELARALVRRGHHVKVLTTDSGGEKRLPVTELGDAGHGTVDGIDVLYYRNISNPLAYRQRIFWPPQMVKQMPDELAGTDIVHVHELRSTIAIPAYHAIRKLSLPYVLSTHGGLRHLGRRGVKVVFDTLWGRRILRDASAILAISPIEESDAIRMNVARSRIRRLPNSIFPPDYAPLPEAGVFKKQWGLGSKRFVLFLGRLHWIKGADLLIRAFHRIAHLVPDLHVVIAGPDDGQKDELHRLVSQTGLEYRVCFTGFLYHQTKLEAFVDADLLVVPSRSEVFAITAAEALICGCPVLLSDVCGLDPMPQPEQGARSFRSEHVDDLAANLHTMLSETPKRFSEDGRRFVLWEFGADKVAERAEVIYCEALKAGQRVVS